MEKRYKKRYWLLKLLKAELSRTKYSVLYVKTRLTTSQDNLLLLQAAQESPVY